MESKPDLLVVHIGEINYNELICMSELPFHRKFREMLSGHLDKIDKNILASINVESIKEFEELLFEGNYRKKGYCDNHLGVFGVYNLINSIKPKLCIISEFGEEMGIVRHLAALAFRNTFLDEGIQVLTGDIGLNVRLSEGLEIYCEICSNYVRNKDIEEKCIMSEQKRILWFCKDKKKILHSENHKFEKYRYLI